MDNFSPNNVLKLLIDHYGPPENGANENDQEIAKYLITIIEDKLADTCSLETYNTLMFVDDYDDDDDDDYDDGDYEDSESESESESDEEAQAEAGGSSQGGSSYAPSPRKRPKWPKLTHDDMKKMYEYRYETKKPRTYQQMKHRFRSKIESR